MFGTRQVKSTPNKPVIQSVARDHVPFWMWNSKPLLTRIVGDGGNPFVYDPLAQIFLGYLSIYDIIAYVRPISKWGYYWLDAVENMGAMRGIIKTTFGNKFLKNFKIKLSAGDVSRRIIQASASFDGLHLHKKDVYYDDENHSQVYYWREIMHHGNAYLFCAMMWQVMCIF